MGIRAGKFGKLASGGDGRKTQSGSRGRERLLTPPSVRQIAAGQRAYQNGAA